MSRPQLVLDLNAEIAVDNFAGGGGASSGFEMATGRCVDIAVNHDPEAVAMHEANHPQTRHFCESVFDIDPIKVTAGRKVGFAWFSPDCKHFSKAKGGKPRSKKIRGLAWVVLNWVVKVRPRVIALENVEEFQTWGPLDDGGALLGHRKGWYFDCFVGALRRRGYKVEWKALRACDYGAPTIRKRLFLMARCDGEPIVWPEPTHGEPGSEAVKKRRLKPWRTAAECIDFTLECSSIFLTPEEVREAGLRIKRPLSPKTEARVAKGIFRYVIDAEAPFIVPAFITECANGSSQRNFSINEPLRTQCAQVKGGHFALVSAFLAKHYTGVTGSDLDEPVGTVTSVDHHSLVTSNLCKLRGDNVGSDVREPLHTVSAQGLHHAEVRALLIKYYGNEREGVDLNGPMHTVTARDRFGLVTVDSVDYVIADIGLRMLQPRELYRAQGFADDYVIGDDGRYGLNLTKTAQVRMCGNSVCPPLAAALVRANVPDMCLIKEGVAV